MPDRLVVASCVVTDGAVVSGQGCELAVPAAGVEGEAVDQHDRLTRASHLVIELRSVHVSVAGGEAGQEGRHLSLNLSTVGGGFYASASRNGSAARAPTGRPDGRRTSSTYGRFSFSTIASPLVMASATFASSSTRSPSRP